MTYCQIHFRKLEIGKEFGVNWIVFNITREKA